jgi:hypothetical protein
MRDPLARVPLDTGRTPVDLLAQCPPPGSTREDRVALLVAAARALRAGEPVSATAGRLLGNALLDWLRHGGNFAQRLKVNRRGDHNNVPRIVARLAVETAEQGRIEGETFVLTVPSSPMSDNEEKLGES